MSLITISRRLRRWLATLGERCEYCRTSEWVTGIPGAQIMGLTACGRATVEALGMNNPRIVRARRLWVAAGWHPPVE
jgi:hypothetical protein